MKNILVGIAEFPAFVFIKILSWMYDSKEDEIIYQKEIDEIIKTNNTNY